MLKRVLKIVLPVGLLCVVLGMIYFASQGVSTPVTDPKGVIGKKELDTLVTAILIMLIIILPVFVLTFFISVKYRASNTKSTYQPEWSHNTKLELLWWGIPIAIVAALSVLAWQTSHSLDPFRPIVSDKKIKVIQVVALQWKWLFIYPDEHVASVGEVAMPVDTPVEFVITSDAPMNSFWIPQLGGQVYAMSGMRTRLHLMADSTGDYSGSSANLSGEGHASMVFTAKARTTKDYTSWIDQVRGEKSVLDSKTYEQLRLPSRNERTKYYSDVSSDLYDSIIARYSDSHMMPMDHVEPASGGTH